MMRVSQKDWMRYVERLSAINQKAADEMQKYIDRYGFDDIDALIRYAYALTTKYGEVSSALACQMYDAMAELEDANVDPAEPADTATFSDVAKNINGALKTSLKIIAPVVGRLVKQAGQDTVLKNAKRDQAYFAWITVGDTCPYCMSIAAEGWKRASSDTIGSHAEHIHGNCNCSFQVKFKKDTDVSGYHPGTMKRMIEDAEGTTEREKINSIRRIQYAEEKESTED